MGDTGFYRFPGNLDPAAEEFFPAARRPVPIYVPFPQHHHFSPPLPLPLPLPLPPPPPPAVALPRPRSVPSRVLLISRVPADVSESMVRRELEVFGDVRAVQMERLRRDGIVTVYFYDLRQAEAALAEIQDQHMQHQYRLRRHHDAAAGLVHASMNFATFVPYPPAPPAGARGLIAGHAVWAQFTAPVISSLPDGTNQGTLVVFNLAPRVSPPMLQRIFEQFGDVREMRNTPKKNSQKFVEFYDVREAARALIGLNETKIGGRIIEIEISRPGGYYRKNYPKQSFTMGIIPAGLPAPAIRHPSGRWVANPDYLSDQREPSSYDRSSSRFSRSSSNSSGRGSAAISMASLNISCRPPHLRKNAGSCSPPTTATSTTSSSGGSAPKKKSLHRRRSKASYRGSSSSSSRRSKVDFDPDPRFLINEDAAIDASSMDSRTSVMIKNIPNKYSQKLLLNMLDNHCLHCNELIGDDEPISSYDFVYLPIDFTNKCNVGYGFVNMTSPEATIRLYKAFHHQSWEVFNSRKICEITYARLQGLEAMKLHFKNSKFPYEVEELMPVVFSPPRDGRRMTEPAALSVRITGPRVKCISSSSSEEGNSNGAVINGFDCDGNGNDEDGVIYCSRGVYSAGAGGSGNGGASGGEWQA